jgi:hypothetical protein
MSKSFKEEHPLGKFRVGEDDEAVFLCRDGGRSRATCSKDGLIFVLSCTSVATFLTRRAAVSRRNRDWGYIAPCLSLLAITTP